MIERIRVIQKRREAEVRYLQFWDVGEVRVLHQGHRESPFRTLTGSGVASWRCISAMSGLLTRRDDSAYSSSFAAMRSCQWDVAAAISARWFRFGPVASVHDEKDSDPRREAHGISSP